VYDCTKYDAIHNHKNLNLHHLKDLYKTAKTLSEFVAPSEYGMTRMQVCPLPSPSQLLSGG
jgi:hypothetical protein